MVKYFWPTIAFILAMVAVITAYDVWAVTHDYGWTISSTLLMAAHDWPIIPFVFGVLAGHLFFPNPIKPRDPPGYDIPQHARDVIDQVLRSREK